MLHELLLFGQVSAENHGTVHQQLAGVTRMPPQVTVERHLIFKPLPAPGEAGSSSGSGQPVTQQQELRKTRQLLNAPFSYVQLIGSYDPAEVDRSPKGRQTGSQNGPGKHDDVPMAADDRQVSIEGRKTALQWSLEWLDIPEPVQAPTTSRPISRTRIKGSDAIQSMKDLGFEYHTQYIVTGSKFYDQDTTLFLHKVLHLPSSEASNSPPAFSTLDRPLDVSNLKPLDPSGGHVLQASIVIADGSSSELKHRAAQQLLAMKETLKPSVDLIPADRLALDTRVPIKRIR